MKRLIHIILFFALAHGAAYAQIPLDSVFWVEKEDSLSTLAIKPVEHPKKLLKSIARQLSIDLEQEPETASKYEVVEVYGTNASVPCTSRCIVSADASLRLRNVEREGDFSFSGPFHLTSQDSSIIDMSLLQFPEMSPLLSHIEGLSISGGTSVLTAINRMMDAYDVAVYSISDDSGRSVYRINFSPKKTEITLANSSIYAMTFNGVAYFDDNTLRLKQARVTSFINTKNPWVFPASPVSHGLSFYPFYAKVSSYDVRKHSRIEYEETGGKLTVKRARLTIIKDKKAVTESMVRRLLE